MSVKNILALLLFVLSTGAALAAETPLGSTREGNRAGTIPAWKGGLTKPPAGFVAGKHHVNPFPKDRPLFTISAANVEKYKKNLTATHYQLIKRYPSSYKMKVYKSRRSCAVPKSVYRAIAANKKNARMTEGGNDVQGASYAMPFPGSKNPIEIYWNHNFHYQGLSELSTVQIGVIFPNASHVPVVLKQKKLFYFSHPKYLSRYIKDNIHFDWFSKVVAPAQMAGSMFSFTNTIDQMKNPRRGVAYDIGKRKTQNLPSSASRYDAPMGLLNGLRVSDDLFLFNGAPAALYDWKLIGKKEIYIPYNVYDAVKAPAKKLLTGKHLNQSVMRYELHRVWVVEAKLKKGKRHSYVRRVFYADEDSAIFTAVDIYDAKGKLFRGQVGFIKNYYEVPTCRQDFDVMYYFNHDYYTIDQLKNDYAPSNLKGKVSPKDFGAAAVRRLAR